MVNSAVWTGLESRVRTMVDSFPGVMGVYVKDLTRADSFGINADTEFPTASTIKIHILTQLLLRAERGELDLSESMHIGPESYVPGSGVITYLEKGVDLTILNVAVLMIIVSDNTATNICIDLAGMDATNEMVRGLGLKSTTLRRKMQDHESVALNLENISTPAECVAWLEHMYNGKPTSGVARQCLEILKKPKNAALTTAIPQGVPLANKPGAMGRVRSDAGIVFLERRPYAIAIMSTFGVSEPYLHDRALVDAARTVHETMATIDDASGYGQAIPR